MSPTFLQRDVANAAGLSCTVDDGAGVISIAQCPEGANEGATVDQQIVALTCNALELPEGFTTGLSLLGVGGCTEGQELEASASLQLVVTAE